MFNAPYKNELIIIKLHLNRGEDLIFIEFFFIIIIIFLSTFFFFAPYLEN